MLPSCLPPPTKFQSNLTTTNPPQPLTHRRAGVTTSRPIGITDTTRPPGKQKSLGNTGRGNFKLFLVNHFFNERISFVVIIRYNNNGDDQYSSHQSGPTSSYFRGSGTTSRGGLSTRYVWRQTVQGFYLDVFPHLPTYLPPAPSKVGESFSFSKIRVFPKIP